MEKDQRSALRNAVVHSRRLLEKEFQEQLEGSYNILSDGRVLESAPGNRIVRARILEVIQHHRAGGATAPEAVDRVVREAAFTVLNRFAALKMAERRELVRECVSQGMQSEGIREFAECAPGLRGALEDGGYRLLLDAVMDEVSLDLKVLFDRRDSMAPLWPGPKALDDLLETLNDPQLADVWAEDEAIGWVYQYFNDNDVKEMRDAAKGGAPRNSRELAVRNQFFTPRYVVEFLTDNTLGRLWYEMTRGETVLRDCSRYLVRRPTEILLKPGESAPESDAGSEAEAGENLSQEDLLRQPAHISHRPLKDPREIRLLDPACGSMHFGLYAFDIFTVIYGEAWEIAHGPDEAAKSAETFAPFVAFAATFPDKSAFLREVPRLIVERNLHGIDIDPRAVQIAGLSLWLRAQRAWHQAGVKPADRPRITRSNLVCAEPMPGEKELLREFVEQQLPAGERPAFAFLLEKIFDRMALAGEAGSLLRIEEEIRTAIADAKRLWKQGPQAEQASLFAEPGEKVGQGEMRLDLSGITDEQFWERAEQRIYDALEAYAEQAENGGGFQRRLFADDAAQGFAFIDVCRKRYDVVVMNPPFGAFSKASKAYAEEQFPDSANDIFAAFVECCLSRLTGTGVLGAITSRVGFFIASFADWRRQIVQKTARLNCFADLGGGVMDNATVEAAAYVLDRSRKPVPQVEAAPFIRLLVHPDKGPALAGAIDELNQGKAQPRLVFWATNSQFALLPDVPFVYWADPNTLRSLAQWPSFEPAAAQVRKGLRTGDNFRFVRALWEIPIEDLTPSISAEDSPSKRESSKWVPLVLSGSSQPWFSPLLVALNWRGNGKELRQYVTKYGSPSRLIQAEAFYFKPGMSWTLRAARFVPYAIPSGCIPTGSRPMAFPKEGLELKALALSASRVASAFMRFYGDWFSRPKFLEGKLKVLPWPEISSEISTQLVELVSRETAFRRASYQGHEPFWDFVKPFGPESDGDNAAISIEWATLLGSELEASVEKAYGLDPSAAADLSQELDEALSFRSASPESEGAGEDDDEGAELLLDCSERARATAALSHAVGCVFGRWDIRYATGGRPVPQLADPFAPLPVCPPGILQGDDGLPLSPEAGRRLRAEGRYPLDVAWDGILLDDPEHPLDLERRVRTALAVVWGDRADALEHEACALLGVPTLRQWFRRPAGFFADHLKRYSKSRRKAPIYWPLSTASGSYMIWLYYHRITADTLFHLVAEYVEPKLRKAKEERLRLEAGQAKAEGREFAKLANQAGELLALEQELEEMKAELLRVAGLPYKPDLNDGVQITAAPLCKLFRLPQWRKDLEATWKKLEKGEYDWAHLAYTIWPDRVREKCKTDRSLVIAHGLEDICEVEVAPKKKRRKKSSA